MYNNADALQFILKVLGSVGFYLFNGLSVLSLCGTRELCWGMGLLSSCGSPALAAVGLLPHHMRGFGSDQGPDPHPLHWKVDSFLSFFLMFHIFITEQKDP